MATCLEPLRDDQIEPGRGGPLRLRDGSGHLYGQRTSRLHAIDIRAAVAPEERYGSDFVGEC